MKLLTHRIAFNCDLFLDIDAPKNATSEELELLVMIAIRQAAGDGESDINDVGLNIEGIEGARAYPRVTPEGSGTAGTFLENFTIENVSEVV